MTKLFHKNIFWYFVFLFYIFYIRLHTLSYEVISWDEATYIIAGLEIIKGYLPFESMFEMKPPLLYYLYSIPLLIDSSLESIRILE